MSRFNVISFDCYGTLVDWDSRVQELLGTKKKLFYDFIFRAAEKEYKPWEVILETALSKFNVRIGVKAQDFADCQAFHDINFLKKLHSRYELAILTNASMAFLERTLSDKIKCFNVLITSDITNSYKPQLEHFYQLIKKVGDPDRIFHVSAHPSYDLEPCKKLGLSSCLLMRDVYTKKIWEGLKFKDLCDLDEYLQEYNLS